MLSRKERVKQVRSQVEKDWPHYIYNWITTTLGDSVDYMILSGNPNITLDVIDANPDKPWDWFYVSELQSVTLEYVLQNLDKEWHWFTLSFSLELTMQDIQSKPDLPWEWDGLSINKCRTITLNDIVANIDKPWSWAYLSANSKFTLADIDNSAHLPWQYEFVSKNVNLTLDYVLSNPEKNWNWNLISQNPGITLDDITSNMDLPWSWLCIACNPNITFEFIDFVASDRLNLDDAYTRQLLSMNPGISINNIIKHKRHPAWDWYYVSWRNDVPLDYIISNPDHDWPSYGKLIQTIDIPFDAMDTILDHDKFRPHLPKLCANMFSSFEKEFQLQQYRMHLASYRIQQHWHRIRLDPRHPVGKRRLEREYDRVFGIA
jgi:hypothetical protein